MNTSLNLEKFLELVDLYKYASIDGERVEIIVSPLKDGDNSKRIITIGLQGGYSRDSDTFVIEDGKEFDEKILPLIVSHYSFDDSLTTWNIVDSGIKDVTIKGSNETESGNLLYVETFNQNLYDDLSKKVDEITGERAISTIDSSVVERTWDEILKYAKSRRMSTDFYKGNVFTKEETDSVYKFVSNVAENEKSLSTGNAKKSKEHNEELLNEVLNDSNKYNRYGLNNELSKKIVDNNLVKKVSTVASAEKKIKRRLDLSNVSIQEKINFAINELDKINYFELSNSKKYDTIKKLMETYSKDSKNYLICKELLRYVEIKNDKLKTNKNINIEQNEIFNVYDDTVVDSYDKFNEVIDLVEHAKLDNEKFNIVIENDANNPLSRRVTINLRGDVSRSDTFKFLFTDGEKFDEQFKEKLREIWNEYPNFMTVANVDKNINNNYSLHTLSGDSEVLIKDTDKLDLLYRRNKESDGVIQKFKNVKKEIETEKINNFDINNNENKKSLIDEFKSINNNIIKRRENRPNVIVKEFKKIKNEIDNNKVNNKEEKEILEKLFELERNINEEAMKQDLNNNLNKNEDTLVQFETLHDYVLKYKISMSNDSNKSLIIYNRNDGSVYTPSSEAEKRNIEFAYYWAVMAGLDESKNDVFYGEKYAFSEENKKLYDLICVQFKESIKRGIDIDFDSLKEQFANSGVQYSDKIFERLFKDNHYVEYVSLYYKKSLGLYDNNKNDIDEFYDMKINSQDLIKIDAEKQARELIKKAELERILEMAKQYAHDIQNQNEQIDLREASLLLAKKIYEESELEVLKNEAKDFAMKILESNGNKVSNDVDELVEKIQKIYEQVVVFDGAKEQARQIQNRNELIELKSAALQFAYDIIRKSEEEKLKLEARKFAHKLIEDQEHENLLVEASRLAKRIIEEAEMQELTEEASIFAKKIFDEINKEKLKEAADEQAKMLQNKNELAYLEEAAKEQAKMLQNKNELAYLEEAAKEQAKMLQNKNELAYLEEAAKEQAKMLQNKNELEDLKEAAKEQAKMLQNKNELAYLEEAAKEQAKMLQNKNELEDLKEAANEQASILNKKVDDNLFEIVNNNSSDVELSPELKELSDAIEVVDSYASLGQPSIKVFFERGNKEAAEVIVSNGIAADEEVVFRKVFKLEQLHNEVIPLLCKLYSKDNHISYEKLFDVPNTTKAGLVIVGDQERLFQVSNAERTFVDFCLENVKKEMNNKKEEEEKMKK